MVGQKNIDRNVILTDWSDLATVYFDRLTVSKKNFDRLFNWISTAKISQNPKKFNQNKACKFLKTMPRSFWPMIFWPKLVGNPNFWPISIKILTDLQRKYRLTKCDSNRIRSKIWSKYMNSVRIVNKKKKKSENMPPNIKLITI